MVDRVSIFMAELWDHKDLNKTEIEEIITIATDQGRDLHHEDENGYTALDIAIKNNNQLMIDIFTKLGVKKELKKQQHL